MCLDLEPHSTAIEMVLKSMFRPIALTGSQGCTQERCSDAYRLEWISSTLKRAKLRSLSLSYR
eukprot:scaffold3473_cov181-Skeletonema_marinoi.AAC.2